MGLIDSIVTESSKRPSYRWVDMLNADQAKELSEAIKEIKAGRLQCTLHAAARAIIKRFGLKVGTRPVADHLRERIDAEEKPSRRPGRKRPSRSAG